MDATADAVSERVLAFYAGLAFNRHATPAAAASDIRRHDPLAAYPILRRLVGDGMRLLDVGCGTGWFANGLKLRCPAAAVTGIDFNPAAIGFAQAVASELQVDTRFSAADLFAYEAGHRFELVVSIGALHHTGDCHGAIRRLARDLLAPGGHLFVGLYHLHGRAPFLAHFADLAALGADEETLLARYRALHPRATDDTHLRSWFRDQVQHPHETQHTLAELMPVLEAAGLALVATSLNGFAPVADLPALLAAEPRQREIATERLQQGRFYPGFFLVLAKAAA